VFDPEERLLGLEGYIQDCTDAKRAREDLEEANRELARRQRELDLVLERAPVVLFAINRDGVFTLSKGAALQALGLAPGEVVGRSLFEMYAGHEVILEAAQRALSGEVVHYSSQVGELVFDTCFQPLCDEAGEPQGAIGLAVDVTRRFHAELALRRSNEEIAQRIEERTAALLAAQARLKHLTDAIPGCVYQYCIHPDGREWFSFISGGSVQVWGAAPEELVRDVFSAWGVVLEEDVVALRASVDEVIRGASTWRHEFRVRHSGRLLWVRAQSIREPLGPDGVQVWNGIFTDITEVRDAQDAARRHQDELAHAMRLATMGELATRLAHEVNQPLAAIMNYVEAWLREATQGHPAEAERTAQRILDQAEHAAQVIRRIRRFVACRDTHRVPSELDRLLREALELAQPKLKGSEVELVWRLEPTPLVMVDPIQVEQVALNLALNAVEAMADVVGQTRRLVISSAVAPGVVRVVFRDNGPGVADDLFDGVFEPFYTTKPQGMGMGLAISRSIIESHGGRVGCENHPEGGAVFWFTLPT
jgi:PAS domain S-box-containing protein